MCTFQKHGVGAKNYLSLAQSGVTAPLPTPGVAVIVKRITTVKKTAP
jgi:hypothetical protein